ncbi:MAG: TolC family protein [Campylobacteraceae bacterium]|nr:TolC family protein [Campylobacteraceae bacterium]
MRILYILSISFIFVYASYDNLTLSRAIELLKNNSNTIKIAKFNEKIAKFKTKIAQSYDYGNLNYTLNALRSNDAGNVFGFKLQSREATFGDFGFSDFLSPPPGTTNILSVQPDDLNYPKARNHFQNKLTYQIPLFTGYKLTQYKKMMKDMEKLSKLDTKKIVNEEIYQTKKTFYDVTLVENYIKHLKVLKENIDKLENIIKAFKAEGYAKDTDILEVKAKKASVLSYLNQAKLNRDLAYQYLEFLIGVKVKSIKHVNELAPLPNSKSQELVKRAIDLKKAELGFKLTKENIKLKKSAFYPTIGAFGEYSTADNKPFNDFFKHDSYTIGAQLKWNIFDGGKKNADYQQAIVEKLQMGEKLLLAKRGLALKIRQIITEVKSKDYDIEAKNEEFQFTKKVYEQFEGKYKEGLEKISDVLIKHSEELKALLELLKVKTVRNQKVFELESLLEEK